jgi:hypothetical protein
MATHAKYAVARVEAARRSSPRGFMKQRGVGDAMRVASFSIPKDTYERLQVIHRKLNTGAVLRHARRDPRPSPEGGAGSDRRAALGQG